MEWVEKVDQRKVFWSIPGPYLRKPMLCTLVRNVSGVKLPPSMYERNTFECNDEIGNADVILSADIRAATFASIKKEECLGESSEDEEDTEDTEYDKVD